ncbi:hypothetical protein PFISCL1PPCAC_24978, partial [Pristionchus fissidentatus]
VAADNAVKCIAKRCDKAWVKNLELPAKHIDYTANKLKCKDDHVMFLGIDPFTDHISCNPDDKKWKNSKNEEIHVKTHEKIEVECKKICYSNLPDSEVLRVPTVSSPYHYSLSCTPTASGLRMVEYNNNLYRLLKCSMGGVTDEHGNVVNGDVKDALAISCKDYCSVSVDPSSLVTLSITDSVTAKCSFPNLAVTDGNALLKDLSCSFNDGWKAGTTPLTNQKETTLSVSCIEVCTFTSNPDVQFDVTTMILKCKDAAKVLLVGKKRTELTCDAYSGWKDVNDPNYSAISNAPLSVSCVDQSNECANFAGQTPTDINVQYVPSSSGNEATIKCKNKKNGESNNALKYDVTILNSNLKCGPVGWRDNDEEAFTATDFSKFACVDSPCVKSVGKLCPVHTAPPGYDCIGTPLSRTDDPSLLRCEKMETLHDQTDFIDKVIRCKDDGTSGTGKWYKKGETNPFDGVSNLICLRLLCNKCKSAP